ncbi:putative membrane protein [Ekhidna lutea]|uniref:Putative membrane protein n=1 Tax=Ekhidna lutea TaxID=447679 RepID=A0A239KEL9_EKHLU|nr:DUF368 domain-containing protein [Ekhidna lutea]SNT16806.1 putative membrane protein [Ekhidna lutea]
MINAKLVLKGAAMGCADLIPGVSGGTIALITGIYEELINSIKSFDLTAAQLAFKLKFKDLWDHVNGQFLVQVFAGIFMSIFLLSRGISYLLDNHPILLWSFFFGLILISSFYVMPRKNNGITYLSFLIGAIVAYLITSLTPASSPDQLWFVFISGAIAICAMILPGISGSFILILLAKYEYVLNAVKVFDFKVIFVFGLGCAVGLLSFSRLIHWLLQRHKGTVMALLAGFMLGSLNKIWPWKLSDDITFRNISPLKYEQLTNEPSLLLPSICIGVFGMLVVFVLERYGRAAE